MEVSSPSAAPSSTDRWGAGKPLDEPIVAIATTDGGGGYYEVASDGGVFAFGDAVFHGSMGGKPLDKPIVGIATTTDGGGYYEVASDGGVFAFGDAVFHGSMGGKPLDEPIVAIATTDGGGGYYEVASDGGVFAFGNAAFHGSMGGKPLDKPIVGIATTTDGGGYFEVASDGGIFAFGDAVFHGSMGGSPLNRPVVGISTSSDGNGYFEVASDGGIFAFGDAVFQGSMGGKAAHPAGGGDLDHLTARAISPEIGATPGRWPGAATPAPPVVIVCDADPGGRGDRRRTWVTTGPGRWCTGRSWPGTPNARPPSTGACATGRSAPAPSPWPSWPASAVRRRDSRPVTPAPGGALRVSLYVQVRNLRESLDLAVELGGTIVTEPLR